MILTIGYETLATLTLLFIHLYFYIGGGYLYWKADRRLEFYGGILIGGLFCLVLTQCFLIR